MANVQTVFIVAYITCLFLIEHTEVNAKVNTRTEFKPDVEDGLRENIKLTYDKEVRPNRTVPVGVTFHLLAINEINTRDETMSLSGYFILNWNDSRLVWAPSTYGDITYLFYFETEVWRPAVIISNEVNKMNVINNAHVPLRVSSDGSVEWSPPLLMKTSCDIDITFYPFDRQTCAIKMQSWAYYLDEITLQTDHIDMGEFSENGEWIIESQHLKRNEDQLDGKSYSTLMFEFYLQRRPAHYVLNVIIPTMLMSFLAPIVFVLPADAGEKVSYSITVFLAYAVLLTMITDSLPTSSKTTSSMSIYLTIITISGAVAVLITVKILEIYHRDESKKIPAMTKTITGLLSRILCKKWQTSTNKVHPSKEKSDVPPKESLYNDAEERLTWKDIAMIWDAFFFRFSVFLAIILASAFLSALVVPYYAYKRDNIS